MNATSPIPAKPIGEPQPAKRCNAGLVGDRRDPLVPRQPPPLLPRDDAQRLPQGVTQQVDRVLHPASPPQRAGIKRCPQRPVAEPAALSGQLDGALHQPPVQVVGDQPGAEADQCALGKRRSLGVQAAKHQLPATVPSPSPRSARHRWRRCRPAGSSPAQAAPVGPAAVPSGSASRPRPAQPGNPRRTARGGTFAARQTAWPAGPAA
jgi:hypothetical protein